MRDETGHVGEGEIGELEGCCSEGNEAMFVEKLGCCQLSKSLPREA